MKCGIEFSLLRRHLGSVKANVVHRLQPVATSRCAPAPSANGSDRPKPDAEYNELTAGKRSVITHHHSATRLPQFGDMVVAQA
jgi:hypothetical protein